jgi:hypothetical protein
MKTSNKQGSNFTNIIIESNSYNSFNKKLTLHNSQYSFTVVITHDQEEDEARITGEIIIEQKKKKQLYRINLECIST